MAISRKNNKQKPKSSKAGKAKIMHHQKPNPRKNNAKPNSKKQASHSGFRKGSRQSARPSIRNKPNKARTAPRPSRSLPRTMKRPMHNLHQKPAAKIMHKHAPQVQRQQAKKQEVQSTIQIVNNIALINNIIKENYFSEYLTTNIGTESLKILEYLASGPQTDEALAAKLELKINDVRRILNALNGHSITRYDTNKDSKGWLIFRWHVEDQKLQEFAENLRKNSSLHAQKKQLPENCNDFFFCEVCYKKDKSILPFETAFEYRFKCSCGKPLSSLTRAEAETKATT